MLALDFCDHVAARAAVGDEVRLQVRGPAATADIPLDGRNLIWRAATCALERAVESGLLRGEPGIELSLHKRVPSRAGLGGGSADAAAALRAVEGALDFDLGPQVRAEILGELGSDTVFFEAAAHTGYAWARGRGERVTPLDSARPPLWIVLLVPTVEAATAEVYAALALRPGTLLEAHAPLDDLLVGRLEGVRSRLFNGLESAACQVQPELARWRELFDGQDADHFVLSGSGSSWFGLYDGEQRAAAELERLRRAADSAGLELRLARVCRPRGAGVGAAHFAEVAP
jgi:4-diphosphocytidyl-2-C-methyl-D-erythritol kinase